MRVFITTCLLLATTGTAMAQPVAPLDGHREEFRFRSGRFDLVGDLLMPSDGAPYPVIVYVWGAGPTNRQRHIENSPVLRVFLERGFAVLLYDKPGSGGSTGAIDNSRQFHELSGILIDAISVLKSRKDIDSRAIGLYGSSQASYVMATALPHTHDVAFMIAWSCPMQSSIDQSAYLVRNYVLCEGGSPAEAAAAEDAYRRRGRAATYVEYRAAAETLEGIPAIRDGLGWAGVAPEEGFTPADTTSESWFDPSTTIASRDIPVLALFAENDRQIDPVQGANTFRLLLAKGHAPGSTVEIIPGADHNMILSPRGCMQDQSDNYQRVGGKTVSPRFLDALDRWLSEWTHRRN